MRILHVSHRYWPCVGGSERHLQEICERLAREGHSVAVYTTDALDFEYFWDPGKRRLPLLHEHHNGVEIRRFPVRHLPWARVSFPGVRWSMTQLSALPINATWILRHLSGLAPSVSGFHEALRTAREFDVVHGMNICFDSLHWPALEMAHRNGVPFLITPLIHLGEADNDRVRRYYTMRHQIELIARADAVLAQTEIERRYLVSRGVPSRKIVKVGVGVNPTDVLGGDATRFREKYGVRTPFVFALGTAAYDKGTYHLVEAMSRLWRRGIHADLVIAGPALDAFVRYFRRQPEWIRRRCRVLHLISDADKRDLLAAGTVMALPSRTDSFGVVYLEAWLYGKPVVGACAGGVPEVIDDGVDGFLVRFGDVGALAEHLRVLLTDQHLAQRMGERGKQKVLERYTWDHVYPVVREVFGQMCRSRAVSEV